MDKLYDVYDEFEDKYIVQNIINLKEIAELIDSTEIIIQHSIKKGTLVNKRYKIFCKRNSETSTQWSIQMKKEWKKVTALFRNVKWVKKRNLV